MKNMKKFFSLVLAIVMVMALAAPVMAAEDHENHTITINKTTPGLKYAAYQIFDGSVTVNDKDTGDESDDLHILSNVDWGTGIDIKKTVPWGTSGNLTLLEALTNASVNKNSASAIVAAIDAAKLVKANAENKDVSAITWSDKENASAIVDALSAMTDNSAAIKEVARIFGEYLSDVCTESKEIFEDGETAGYKINPLTDGYYLVKQTELVNDETATEYLLDLIQDVTITPKDGKVTVDKGINDGTGTLKDATSVDIGDVVTFEVIADLPDNYAEFETFYYVFVDTMTDGLTFNEDSLKVYLINEESQPEVTAHFVLLTGDEITTRNSDADTSNDLKNANGNQNATFAVEFADLKELTKDAAYTVNANTKIKLVYTATVNENAMIGGTGNINEIRVGFDNDPYSDNDPTFPPPSIVKVYSFQLDVTKKDGETGALLNGVQFVLIRERQGHEQYAVVENGKLKGWTNWLTEADINDYVKNHEEYKLLGTEAQAEKVKELKSKVGFATQLTTNAEGKISVAGLDVGIYKLRETKHLEGYDPIADIEFTIHADYDVEELKTLTLTMNGKTTDADKENGIVAFTVVNNPGEQLPSTGGMGTTLFYVSGSIMVVGAAVLLITKKRMAA